MPNCFSLTKYGEKEPTPLARIDEELCAHVGVEADPVHWLGLGPSYDHKRTLANWYDIYGLRFAMGETYQSISDSIVNDKDLDAEERIRCLAIINYLSEHYIVSAWAER